MKLTQGKPGTAFVTLEKLLIIVVALAALAGIALVGLSLMADRAAGARAYDSAMDGLSGTDF